MTSPQVTKVLILAPVPEVRSWPFYGKALDIIRDLVSWPYDEPALLDHAAQHRDLVVERLREARRAVAMLEADLAAIDGVWTRDCGGNTK